MELDFLKKFEAGLFGKSCLIMRREYDWCINFDDGSSIALNIPWRIVVSGRIAFAAEDHGQMFGLPEPVDGEKQTRKLLMGRHITSATVDRQTADIKLFFGSNTRLDAFNNSSGYEGWKAEFILNGKWMTIVAMGGGEVSSFISDHKPLAPRAP